VARERSQKCKLAKSTCSSHQSDKVERIKCLQQVEFTLVKRDANLAAISLSKFAISQLLDDLWKEECLLTPLVKRDANLAAISLSKFAISQLLDDLWTEECLLTPLVKRDANLAAIFLSKFAISQLLDDLWTEECLFFIQFIVILLIYENQFFKKKKESGTMNGGADIIPFTCDTICEAN
jgi:hypothetical protein